jgi:hypothetical protein
MGSSIGTGCIGAMVEMTLPIGQPRVTIIYIPRDKRDSGSMWFTWVRYSTVVLVFILLFPLQFTLEAVEADGAGTTHSQPTSVLDNLALRPPESPLSQMAHRLDGIREAPALATDSNGTTHAVWVEGFNHEKREVRYSRSLDGGRNWSTSMAISTLLTTSAGFPNVMADESGRVFVLWKETRGGHLNVLLRASMDGGSTFGAIGTITPINGYTDCIDACVTSTADGGVYGVVMNSKEREGSASDFYAIGWCSLDTKDHPSSQFLVRELGLARRTATMDVCVDGNDDVVIAYHINRIPYIAWLKVSTGNVSLDPLPYHGSVIGRIEVMHWHNRTEVLYIDRENYRTYVHHVWTYDENRTFSSEDLYDARQQPSDGTTLQMLDAEVSADGLLQTLLGTYRDNTMLLVAKPLKDEGASISVHSFYADEHDENLGAAIAPQVHPGDISLLCTPHYVEGDGPYQDIKALECLVWNWTTLANETKSYLGVDTMYRSDRSNARVCYGQDGTTHMVWCEPRGHPWYGWYDYSDVFYARRPVGASGFEAPVQLNAPNLAGWQMLDIGISSDGTVYVAWFGTGCDSEFDSWPYGLLGVLSEDQGTTWSEPMEIDLDRHRLEPPLYERDFQIESSPNGTMFLAFTIEYVVDRDTRRGLLVLGWKDDFKVFLREGLLSVNLYGGIIQSPALQISEEGNPHVVCEYRSSRYSSPTRLVWLRSKDGGSTWEEPVDIPVGLDILGYHRGWAALESDNVMTIAFMDPGWGGEMLNTSLYWCTMDLTTNTSSFVQLVDNRSAPFPIFGAVRILPSGDDASLIFYLGLDGADVPGPDVRYETVLCAVEVSLDGTVRSRRVLSSAPGEVSLDLDDHSNEVSKSYLDATYEPGGAPVIATSVMDDETGHLGVYVWRTNHLPEVTNVTEAAGGWVLGPEVRLEVEPEADPDGDPLEYRFSIWLLEGDFCLTGPWRPLNTFPLPRLDHGPYCWSVEVRDPYGSVLSEEGWWFRYDHREPTAHAGGPYIGSEGMTLELSGTDSSDDGPISTWEWDLEGDGVFEYNTTVPTLQYRAVDDFEGVIVLRVTDEADRQALDTAVLIIHNTPPACMLRGHERLVAGDNVTFGVNITDAGELDTHTVQWYGEDGPLGEGPEVTVHLSMPGEFLLLVRVEDNDGGVCSRHYYITVNHKPLSIQLHHPETVWMGDEFRMYITDNYDQPLEGLNVSWNVDGVTVGTGRELWRTAYTAGTLDVWVKAEDPEGHTAEAAGMVRVRERLEPVLLEGPTEVTNTSITIGWTASSPTSS